jgi:catechol 2,3-dioxygenase-like lactoylglutathione lyase family enzyme
VVRQASAGAASARRKLVAIDVDRWDDGGRAGHSANRESRVVALSDHPVHASIAVSDIERAVAFYEGKLGLSVLERGPSAQIVDGSRIYGSGGGPALAVYQSEAAGTSAATLAIWYVEDIDRIVDELTAAGVEFTRYDAYEADAKGIAPRAGGGRIAWFQDPDGNTFAIEADT